MVHLKLSIDHSARRRAVGFRFSGSLLHSRTRKYTPTATDTATAIQEAQRIHCGPRDAVDSFSGSESAVTARSASPDKTVTFSIFDFGRHNSKVQEALVDQLCDGFCGTERHTPTYCAVRVDFFRDLMNRLYTLLRGKENLI